MATWQLGLAHTGHHTVFPGNVWKYKKREFWKHLEKPKSSERGKGGQGRRSRAPATEMPGVLVPVKPLLS